MITWPSSSLVHLPLGAGEVKVEIGGMGLSQYRASEH